MKGEEGIIIREREREDAVNCGRLKETLKKRTRRDDREKESKVLESPLI